MRLDRVQAVTGEKHQCKQPGPGARPDILQPPGFGEGLFGDQFSPVRDADVNRRPCAGFQTGRFSGGALNGGTGTVNGGDRRLGGFNRNGRRNGGLGQDGCLGRAADRGGVERGGIQRRHFRRRGLTAASGQDQQYKS